MSDMDKTKLSDMVTKGLLGIVTFFLVQQYYMMSDMKGKIDTFYGKQVEVLVTLSNLSDKINSNAFQIEKLKQYNINKDEWIREWTETHQSALDWAIRESSKQ